LKIENLFGAALEKCLDQAMLMNFIKLLTTFAAPVASPLPFENVFPILSLPLWTCLTS